MSASCSIDFEHSLTLFDIETMFILVFGGKYEWILKNFRNYRKIGR